MRTTVSLSFVALLGLVSACAHSPTLSTDIPVRMATQSYLKNLAKAEVRASEVVRLTDYKLIAAESTPQLMGQRSRETPIYSQPLPTAMIVETFLLEAHTT
jgi:hypothetical protein